MPIDYKRYPPNWLTEIRPRILERANDCCERCKAPNHAFIYRPHKGKPDWKLAPADKLERAKMALAGTKFTEVVLTIAHLDHDPENHEVQDERLQALCQRCHLLLDMPHHVSNRKYGRDYKRNNYKIEFDGEEE